MTHPAAEPDARLDEERLTTGVRRVTREDVAARMKPLPKYPSDEEIRLNPRALFEYQHNLEVCRRDDTIEMIFRSESLAADSAARAKAFEDDRAHYQAHVAEFTELYRNGAKAQEAAAATLKSLKTQLDGIEVEVQAQGTAIENLTNLTRQRHNSVETSLRTIREELAQERGRIDQLDQSVALLLADLEARSKQHAAQTTAPPGTSDRPGNPSGTPPGSTSAE